MADEKPVVKQKYLRVPVSNQNFAFLSYLNERTRKSFSACVKAEIAALIETLKRGKQI